MVQKSFKARKKILNQSSVCLEMGKLGFMRNWGIVKKGSVERGVSNCIYINSIELDDISYYNFLVAGLIHTGHLIIL